MTDKNDPLFQQAVQLARLQTWVMSFVCGLLALFVAAAAIRMPHYLAVSDYARLTAVILFGLVVLAGVIDNVHTHVCLRQLHTILQKENDS